MILFYIQVTTKNRIDIYPAFLLYILFYCGLYCRAVCITRNFSESQNPRFIIESSFKSRAGYNGACRVNLLITGNSNNPTWNGKPCASPVSLSRFHTCVVGKSLLCMRGGWVLPAKQKVKALCFLQKQQYERNRRPERRYEWGKSMYYVILFLDRLSFCTFDMWPYCNTGCWGLNWPVLFLLITVQ